MAAALNFQDRIVQPQAPFPVNQGKAFMCLDADGTTIRRFTFEECHNTYFVLFFFPMDFKCDSSEVRAFTRLMPQFTENHTKVVGVTQDSPYVLRQWTVKEEEKGGFGSPAGFPILSDKAQYLAQLLGAANPSGMPCRATYLVDWTNTLRYMMVHQSELGRSVKEILRLTQAFRYSDLTGHITPSRWELGGPIIPTDYTKKCQFYQDKYGTPATKGAKVNEGSESESTASFQSAISGQQKSANQTPAAAGKNQLNQKQSGKDQLSQKSSDKNMTPAKKENNKNPPAPKSGGTKSAKSVVAEKPSAAGGTENQPAAAPQQAAEVKAPAEKSASSNQQPAGQKADKPASASKKSAVAV